MEPAADTPPSGAPSFGARTFLSANATAAQKPPLISSLPKPIRILIRLIIIIAITYSFGWVLNKSVQTSEKNVQPPGFLRGALHGALMPGAMPSLLFGKDMVIYAERNSGRLYKLGYTFGVNACGLLFFGVFYYRLNKWRKIYGANR